MMSGNRISGIPPLRPPGAGPDPRASCDFLGSPCPRRRYFLGGFLGGFIDFDDELDFDEFIEAIYADSNEDDEFEEFEELAEHYNNQRW
jgi:hypothetical protein